MVVIFEALTAAIGLAGDVVYVPLRVAAGRLSGLGADVEIIGGTDFAAIYADEKLVHNGNLVVADPLGDVLIWYDGSTQTPEGSYDDLLDGRLPVRSQSRLRIRTRSTNPGWRSVNSVPVLAVGWFDGESATLDVTLLSITENDGRN